MDEHLTPEAAKLSELWNAHGPWCDKCGAPILEGRTEFLRALHAILEGSEQREEGLRERISILEADADYELASALDKAQERLREAIAELDELVGSVPMYQDHPGLGERVERARRVLLEALDAVVRGVPESVESEGRRRT